MGDRMRTSPWFPYSSALARPDVRLFCFHYAGGTASVYRDWAALFPPSVEVCRAEFPGRSGRFREPPITEVSEAIGPLLEAVQSESSPVALFGQSLGALVAFELARGMRDAGTAPVALVVASRRAPQ